MGCRSLNLEFDILLFDTAVVVEERAMKRIHRSFLTTVANYAGITGNRICDGYSLLCRMVW